jgi:flagellar assembly factor FliW
MEIDTSRFGRIEIDSESLIRFPAGLLGLEECRTWVLLADGDNDSLAWLQSTDRADVALAVVSPRRYVPDFRMRVARRELAALALDDVQSAKVLVIVGKRDRTLTLNLKAPLLINAQRRVGGQVVTNGDLPIRYELPNQAAALRRSA